VRVGLEASGYSQWFVEKEMLAKLTPWGANAVMESSLCLLQRARSQTGLVDVL